MMLVLLQMTQDRQQGRHHLRFLATVQYDQCKVCLCTETVYIRCAKTAIFPWVTLGRYWTWCDYHSWTNWMLQNVTAVENWHAELHWSAVDVPAERDLPYGFLPTKTRSAKLVTYFLCSRGSRTRVGLPMQGCNYLLHCDFGKDNNACSQRLS